MNEVQNRFVYDGEDIIAEFEGDTVSAIYLHGPGIDEPIAMLRDVNKDEEFTGSELFFFARDHLNSIHSLTDKDGRPVQRYNYSAYGKTKVEKTNPAEKLIKNSFAYSSREWEEETGDYYYRARYYNPNTGRFLSPDPISFLSGDMNLYRYVTNNPLNSIDPFGLTDQDVMDAIAYVNMKTGGAADISYSFLSQEMSKSSSGFAIPPFSYILVDYKYSKDLNDAQKQQLLATIFHESTHINDGLLKSYNNTQERHEQIDLTSKRFAANNLQDFLNFQQSRLKPAGSSGGSCGN